MPVLDPVTKKALLVVTVARPLPESLLGDPAPTRRLALQCGITVRVLGDHLVGFEAATLCFFYRIRNVFIHLYRQNYRRREAWVRAIEFKFNQFLRETRVARK